MQARRSWIPSWTPETHKSNLSERPKCPISFIKTCLVFFWQSQCYQTRGLGTRLGYFWLSHHGQQSLAATSLLLGYFLLPGREMSLNRASLWKIVNFLSIQGDFESFQHQWADLSSIDRIETSYGAIVGDYPQLPELDNLSFFRPIGWFLVSLPHKSAQNETVVRILAWWKNLPRFGTKFLATLGKVWFSDLPITWLSIKWLACHMASRSQLGVAAIMTSFIWHHPHHDVIILPSQRWRIHKSIGKNILLIDWPWPLKCILWSFTLR